jgi:hypothetical protein
MPQPISEDRGDFPYVLEIQSNLLYQFAERVCAPLVRPGQIPGLSERFNPSLVVQGEAVQLHPLGIAVFLASELRNCVGSVHTDFLSVETALDMLLRGY